MTEPIIAYRSHDGILIYSKPGGSLSPEEQEERFARIRRNTAVGRVAVEDLPGGGRDPRVLRSPDELLDQEAHDLMRRIFASHPTEGTRLYLAWSYFRIVRRPGSPDAGKLEEVRAALKSEMVKAELVAAAGALEAKSNGSNGAHR